MITSLMRYAQLIVSCGPCALIPYASIAASLFALPSLVFFQMLYWFFPSLCIILLCLSGCTILASFLLILYAQKPTDFIIDKVIGAMLTFIAIPFTAKYMIVGFTLFHLIRLSFPLILKTCAPSLRQSVWYTILASLGAGIISNIFLQFVIWVGK